MENKKSRLATRIFFVKESAGFRRRSEKNSCEFVGRPRSEHKGLVLLLVLSHQSSYFSEDLSYLILLGLYHILYI